MITLGDVIFWFLVFSSLFWITIAAVLVLIDGLVLIKNRRTKGDVELIFIKFCQIKTLLLCMLCGALLLFLCVIAGSDASSYLMLLEEITFVWIIIEGWLVIIAAGILLAGTIIKEECCR
ncbi:hypothetical protein HYT26_01490 [Candidatus Pacearchaeota archaeon]|nr:hypothetical protein [Candidatus Pacearchaeota archaeon]